MLLAIWKSFIVIESAINLILFGTIYLSKQQYSSRKEVREFFSCSSNNLRAEGYELSSEKQS